MINIKNYIIEESKKLGIDIIGFTDGEPLIDIKDYLIYKRKSNKYTEFEEKDIEKRINPRLTFPDCKSIIVLAMSYNVDYKIGEGIGLKGSLSKSSWGLDYHKVLKEKMETLVYNIKKKKDFQYMAFSDTGPLVDRELAKKAGIGYYGKNCSIISHQYGSFIFLGYILTDMEIEMEAKIIEDECGDCNLCIQACPTAALESAYNLNPKKCISYLTQTKDIIPDNLREKMGIKIYGCDTCQIVCPKNKGVRLSSSNEFMPVKTKGVIDLKELLSMSNREFRDKYGDMAGGWRGKNTLKRNAIIALGNVKDKDNIPLLYREKEKDIESLNEYIKWAMEKINSNRNNNAK